MFKKILLVSAIFVALPLGVLAAGCDDTTACSGAVFCSGFEEGNKNIWDDYDDNPDSTNFLMSSAGPCGSADNTIMRLRVPAGRGGADLVKVLPSSYDKLYARWYFKYEPGFDFSAMNHGGGLSAGDRNYIGQSGNRPDGSDFAGFYLQYDENNSEPYAYSYYRGMYQDCTDPDGNCWGDSLPCIYDNGSSFCTIAQDRPIGTMPTLVSGQWYCYEQMVDMGAASANGIGATGRVTQWLDGVQFGDSPNLWLRTTTNLKLQNIWLSLFHHADHSVVGEYLDNVVISTQRIGCLGAADVTVPGSPTGLSVW